jgi:hypothetical protein
VWRPSRRHVEVRYGKPPRWDDLAIVTTTATVTALDQADDAEVGVTPRMADLIDALVVAPVGPPAFLACVA